MLHTLKNLFYQGGPVFWGLLLLSVLLYGVLFVTWIEVFRMKKNILPFLDTPHSQGEIDAFFSSFSLGKLAWIERRLPFMGVLIACAPLAGLLGTVSGMLATFHGLANSSTATPIDKISAGISEALITTQTGLLIAIPAAFLLALLRNQAQTLHRNLEAHRHATKQLFYSTNHVSL